jgi:hypothetical protein
LTHRAPLTNHHADGTDCPVKQKRTYSGEPLHLDRPGRAYTQAICSCGDWQMKNPGKGYVNESRRRHLASHTKPTGPKFLRDLLSLDAR